ncbi:hypothetical protein FSW04_09480 [Baekduia soli]|uniref:Uncharacterized protein n=1 Tax=Baekduia soli TaxID=496014 RepID=A0A5B8U4I7_9ACTN|nr:hypothetical protein [Baekduia soli]QEC47778.1 hypothetical protein FSW04_09480 [Baekduia soli]
MAKPSATIAGGVAPRALGTDDAVEVADNSAGLMGAILNTKPGMGRPDGSGVRRYVMSMDGVLPARAG